MKKLISIMLLCAMTVLWIPQTAMAALLLEYDGAVHEYTGSIFDLKVNGQSLSLPLSPIIFNDRAVVPVREIFESVGAEVYYEGNTQEVEVISPDTYVRLKINDNVAYVNGKKTMIPDDVVPKLITKVGGETKTMVPVRFISENIGMDVDFDAMDEAILINTPDYTPQATAAPTAAPTPVLPPAATATPEQTKAVTNISYQVSGSNTVQITVKSNSQNLTFSKFTLSDPLRVVVDLPHTQNQIIQSQIQVNQNGVQSLRLGYDEGRTRIVADVSSLKSYDVKTQGSNLIITVTTSGSAAVPTQSPVQTVRPTQKPSQGTGGNITADPEQAKKKTIVLDAGHGGSDGGADSTMNGTTYYEKNLTLSITKKVRDILVANGYNVVLTREGDTYPTLTERADLANQLNAALFISIHINSATADSASGTEVYYSEQNNGTAYGTSSSVLAKNILDGMMKYMGTRNRGVKTADHAVTRRSLMPAALVEVGFISNAEELQKMLTDDFQQKTAQGIAEGIMQTWQNVTIPSSNG